LVTNASWLPPLEACTALTTGKFVEKRSARDIHVLARIDRDPAGVFACGAAEKGAERNHSSRAEFGDESIHRAAIDLLRGGSRREEVSRLRVARDVSVAGAVDSDRRARVEVRPAPGRC
jgi:hypothetical protein